MICYKTKWYCNQGSFFASSKKSVLWKIHSTHICASGLRLHETYFCIASNIKRSCDDTVKTEAKNGAFLVKRFFMY
jgi:hypothetical protein